MAVIKYSDLNFGDVLEDKLGMRWVVTNRPIAVHHEQQDGYYKKYKCHIIIRSSDMVDIYSGGKQQEITLTYWVEHKIENQQVGIFGTLKGAGKPTYMQCNRGNLMELKRVEKVADNSYIGYFKEAIKHKLKYKGTRTNEHNIDIIDFEIETKSIPTWQP